MTTDVRTLLRNAAESEEPRFTGAQDAMRRGVRLRWYRRVQVVVPLIAVVTLVLLVARPDLPIFGDAQQISPAERGRPAPGAPDPVAPDRRVRETPAPGSQPRVAAAPDARSPADASKPKPPRAVSSLGLTGRLAFTAMNELVVRGECLNPPCFHPSPSDIQTMDLRSGRVSQVTSSPLFEQESAWSPDGSRLAYSLARGDGTASLYTMRADGSENRAIVTSESASAHRPAWSPDGRRIAFVHEPVSGGAANVAGMNQQEIWMVDPDGTDLHRVDEIEPGGYVVDPAWSPDGRYLAFVRSMQGPRVYALDLVTRRIEWIGAGRHPDWSPDGKTMAVAMGDDLEIIAVPSGNVLERISRSGHSFSSPDWSPDGKWIAFAASRPGSSDPAERRGSIWVARPNGAEMNVVVEGDQEYWGPSWGVG